MDRDTRDVGAGKSGAIVEICRRADDDNGNEDDGKHAPESKLAPHAAAVDDQVGIKRHGRGSSASVSLVVIPGPRIVRKPAAPILLRLLFFFLVFLLTLALERGAQNIAERRARIRRSVLRDRLLLLGDFERLDGDGDLLRAAIELDYAGIDFLANREAIRTLLRTIARQFRTLDKGRKFGADDLHVDPAFLYLGHLAGHDRTFFEFARSLGVGSRSTGRRAV